MANILSGQIFLSGFLNGRPILLLIYINNLSDNVSSNPKHFVDGTSLFSVVHDINQSEITLNDYFQKESSWSF